MNRFGFVATLVVLLASCNGGKEEQMFEKKEDEVSVFPVSSFIKGQLREIETAPLTILKIVEENSITDSAWLGRDSLRTFVAPFLRTTIDSATLSPYFSSKSIYDPEEDKYILDYTAKRNLPDSIDLQQISVYINAKDHSISTIYLVRDFKVDTHVITKQLIWRVNHSCSINTIVQAKEEPIVKKEKMIWDF